MKRAIIHLLICSARGIPLACLIILALCLRSASAADEPKLRMIDRPPHDLLVLVDRAVQQEGKKDFEIEPLDLPGRRLPTNQRPSDKLTVRMLENPTEQLTVRWSDIAEIRLFEQMILDEARPLVEAGKLDDAFEYFQFLDLYYPDFPGVAAAVQGYLFEDARALARKQQYDAARGVLMELYGRNPQYDGLGRGLANVTGRLIDEFVAQDRNLEARRMITQFAEMFPNDENVTAWSNRFLSEAEAKLRDAVAAEAAGHHAEAQQLATDAVRIWPALTSAKAFLTERFQAYPVIRVGVSLPSRPATEAGLGLGLNDWAALRTSRLVCRRLLELAAYEREGEGGTYLCPLGEFQTTDLGLRLEFRLRADNAWSDGRGTLSGIDVARNLLAMADSANPRYRPDWADLFSGVEVRDVYQVDVELRRSHVRPEGMLQVPLEPAGELLGATPSEASIGSYVLAGTTADDSRFVATQAGQANGRRGPAEVHERYYRESRQAIRDLELGRITVLDRVCPWDLAKTRAHSDLVVEPYAVPTVHCLIPNLKKPFTSRRTFRRALVYGIHREGLLVKKLLRNQQVSGCQVISGPFPTGYAYNTQVAPHPYDPRLALTLAEISRREVAQTASAKMNPTPPEAAKADPTAAKQDKTAEPAKAPEVPPLPTLVLAHPADEVARVACEEIKRHLELVGIKIELKALDPGAPQTMSDDIDLLYAELLMWEPVVDARRLLGSEGLVGQSSPYVELLLRQLDECSDWKTARDRLLHLHQTAHDELPLIPLWQLTDFFAYRRGLEGMGSRPVWLYQHVEDWQSTPWLPPDAP